VELGKLLAVVTMFLGGVLPNINPVLLPMKSSKAIPPLYFNHWHGDVTGMVMSTTPIMFGAGFKPCL
jgi:hypothetical protein